MTTVTEATFVQGRQISQTFGITDPMLKRWRKSGRLVEGAHWVRISHTTVLYNLELMQHFIHYSHQPEVHASAVAEYQESLPYQQLCIDGSAEPHQSQFSMNPD